MFIPKNSQINHSQKINYYERELFSHWRNRQNRS